MKSEKKLLGAGLLSALLASLCCITPLLALIAGGSGFASTFTWLEPARPFFIILTIGTLAFAWYQKLFKSKKEIDCNCEDSPKESFLRSKAFLGIISVFALIMLCFPYYSSSFYSNTNTNKEVLDVSSLKKSQFTVLGMTCSSCEAHVNHEVNKLQGVVKVTTSYENKNAVVEYDDSLTSIDEIEKAIEKTGYQVIDKF